MLGNRFSASQHVVVVGYKPEEVAMQTIEVEIVNHNQEPVGRRDDELAAVVGDSATH